MLFSMTEYCSRRSDSNFSILVNSVTGFFEFMSRSAFSHIVEGAFEAHALESLDSEIPMLIRVAWSRNREFRGRACDFCVLTDALRARNYCALTTGRTGEGWGIPRKARRARAPALPLPGEGRESPKGSAR